MLKFNDAGSIFSRVPQFLQFQNWMRLNCSSFISKDEWLPNSSDLCPLDYHVRWTMLELTSCSQNPTQFSTWRTHCKYLAEKSTAKGVDSASDSRL